MVLCRPVRPFLRQVGARMRHLINIRSSPTRSLALPTTNVRGNSIRAVSRCNSRTFYPAIPIKLQLVAKCRKFSAQHWHHVLVRP